MEVQDESSSDSWSSCSSADSNAESMTEKLLNLKSPYFNSTLALRCKTTAGKSESTSCSRYHSIVHFKVNVPSFKLPPGRRGRGRGAGRGAPIPIPNQNPQSKSSPQPSTSKSVEKNVEKSSSVQEIKVTENEKEKEKKSESEPFYPIPGRKFLPHQLPVYVPRKKHPNVLTLMDTELGPLSVLNEVRKEGRRIKVWTRNITGIRGFCVGTLDAFDKHWNLLLRDVDEQFQRKRRIKFPLEFSGDLHEQEQEENLSYKSGEFLSSYSQNLRKKSSFHSHSHSQKENISSIEEGMKTMCLVDGPDALKTCRLGFQQIPSETSKLMFTTSQMRKKRLVVLDKPVVDFHENHIVAQSKNYEIVERHVRQLFLMGNEVIFIETELKPG